MALDAFAEIFASADGNTPGWVDMLERAAGVIARCDAPRAEDKLVALRPSRHGEK